MTGKKEAIRAVPIVKVYPNGGSAGNPPSVSNHERAKRGKVQGWTKRAARNQRNFFFAVDIHELTGHGFSFSLTLRNCPPDSSTWAALRKRLIDRLRLLGMIRGHWLTEWQGRACPHLHGIAYFEDPGAGHHIVPIWLDIAQEFEAGFKGQDCKSVHSVMGWLQYLAKHGARGVDHYQRSNHNIPKAWKEHTGRLWGKVGDWPIREAMRFSLDREGYRVFRRLYRGYCLAKTRAAGEWRSVSYLKHRMLKCNDRTLSEVRGVSDWVPADVQVQMILWLGSQGYRCEQVFDD